MKEDMLAVLIRLAICAATAAGLSFGDMGCAPCRGCQDDPVLVKLERTSITLPAEASSVTSILAFLQDETKLAFVVDNRLLRTPQSLSLKTPASGRSILEAVCGKLGAVWQVESGTVVVTRKN